MSRKQQILIAIAAVLFTAATGQHREPAELGVDRHHARHALEFDSMQEEDKKFWDRALKAGKDGSMDEPKSTKAPKRVLKGQRGHVRRALESVDEEDKQFWKRALKDKDGSMETKAPTEPKSTKAPKRNLKGQRTRRTLENTEEEDKQFWDRALKANDSMKPSAPKSTKAPKRRANL